MCDVCCRYEFVGIDPDMYKVQFIVKPEYTIIKDYTHLYPNERGESPCFEVRLGPCVGPNIRVARSPRMCACVFEPCV